MPIQPFGAASGPKLDPASMGRCSRGPQEASTARGGGQSAEDRKATKALNAFGQYGDLSYA